MIVSDLINILQNFNQDSDVIFDAEIAKNNIFNPARKISLEDKRSEAELPAPRQGEAAENSILKR